jgi:tripartite-type tricarboxylate transporter receptor subunit TctC
MTAPSAIRGPEARRHSPEETTMSRCTRRTALVAGLLFGALTVLPSARAQDRPVRLLAGFPAGGTIDVVARLVADKLKDSLGQPVIVDNRAGAAGRIAAEVLKNSPADGSVIMLAPIGVAVVSPHAYKSNPFDTLKDFAPVSLAANIHLAMAVANNTPAKNLKEYVAWAKANKDKAFYATSGAGTLPHFLGLLLAREAGVDLTHVPYKGAAAYQGELISGQIPAAFDAMGDLSEYHKAGKLRIIATSGSKRSGAMPEIPTMREEGYNVQGDAWFGFFAPAATPKAVIDKYSAAIAKAVNSPDVAARLAALNMEPVGSTPDEFGAIVRRDWDKWGAVVKASGFTAD